MPQRSMCEALQRSRSLRESHMRFRDTALHARITADMRVPFAWTFGTCSLPAFCKSSHLQESGVVVNQNISPKTHNRPSRAKLPGLIFWGGASLRLGVGTDQEWLCVQLSMFCNPMSSTFHLQGLPLLNWLRGRKEGAE